MENTNYKNKDVGKKCLKIMQKNQFSKVKNCLLELEKDFIELKDVELKDREVKIKKRQKNYYSNQLLCLYMIWIGLLKRNEEYKTN